MILDDGGDATLLLHLGTRAESDPSVIAHAGSEEETFLFASIKETLKRDPKWYSTRLAKVRGVTEAALHQLWPHDGAGPGDLSGGESATAGVTLFEAVAALEPKTDAQRLLKSRALEIAVGMGHIRQQLVVNNERSIPAPFLLMLGVWQAVLFAGFGLLAPRNATTFTVLTVCMLSVSGALFLVLELDRPFAGMIRVSDTPLRSVLAHLGQ
jgi:hypothetical protein